jgi:UDP-2,3-diacylglucosamine pyrophosphatase LpxH
MKPSVSNTQHIIEDRENCEVAVISDLHKYSGVSTFSKGDNPFFDAYVELYKNGPKGLLGEMPRYGSQLIGQEKAQQDLSDEERRAIEEAVKGHYPASVIQERIDSNDNPFADPYFELYKEDYLGPIPKYTKGDYLGEEKLAWDMDAEDRRKIEQKVKEQYSPEDVEQKINEMWDTSERREGALKHSDPDKMWKRRQEIFKSFHKSKYVVLNGDIFDIQCSKNPKKKILEAVAWLKKRMDEAPDTQFHFVLGNHEAYRKFINAMHALEQTAENGRDYSKQFHFHENYFKLNDSLFVHGDEYLGKVKYVKSSQQVAEGTEVLADDGETKVILEPLPATEKKRVGRLRHIKEEEKELGGTFRGAYEKFNGFFHMLRNKWDGGMHGIVRKLYHNIESSDTEGLSAAFKQSNHVFSGHIHSSHHEHYQDKEFWNTGAAVGSVYADFHPLRIHMGNGVTKHVRSLLTKDREKYPQRPIVEFAPGEAKNYFVVSDLHMFAKVIHHGMSYSVSRYDKEPKLREAIDKAMDKADVIVLNGDIFEMFYTPDLKKVAADSVQWLKELIAKYPKKEIHFVLGNHEGVREFVDAVKEIKADNFKFHERAFQPNEKTLFMHGDEIVAGKYGERHIYTFKTAWTSLMTRFFNHAGEGPAMGSGFMRWYRPPEWTAKNLFKTVADPRITEKTKGEVTHGDKVENIFIGHTHIPFVDFPVKNEATGQQRWATNTGSATNWGSLAAVSFDMGADGRITEPKVIPHSLDMGVISLLPPKADQPSLFAERVQRDDLGRGVA